MERTPLHLACIRGHYNVVEVLVMHGADINARDIDRNTALHYSAEYGHAMIVSWLLQRRPDLTIRNRLGKTPPDMAASMEVSEIFKEYHRKFESETAAPTAYKRDL
jgi:ankyrin repeat protein